MSLLRAIASIVMPHSRSMAVETTYKRLPSREETNTDPPHAVYIPFDVVDYPSTSPPWQLSLPHVCVATLAAVLFGYHTGVVNAPLPYIAQDLGFADDALAQGSVVSASLFGAFFGCAASGMVADEFGRRRSFQFSAIPMLIGACLSALSPNLGTMILGRFLVGLGLGVSGPVTALYVSEISPTAVRGTYGGLCQIATCIGILGSLVVGLPVATFPGWWRSCFWISAIPAALLALGMEFCSESPRWLFKQSRWSEAEHEIGRLWGGAHVKTAMADLARNNERLDEGEEATVKELFGKKYLKVIIIGATLFALQQLAGINSIFYFSSSVFRHAGINSDLIASVSVGVVNLVASCLAACMMDRQGRRSLLIWSFFGMFVAMVMQAAAASVSALASFLGLFSLIGTLMYVFMFALGAGPVPALLLPEIFPARIRAKGMAISMCVHWVTNCLVGLLFLHLLEKFGTAILYSFFASVSLIAVFFVKKNVLETKGKSLEEIEASLLDKVNSDF